MALLAGCNDEKEKVSKETAAATEEVAEETFQEITDIMNEIQNEMGPIITFPEYSSVADKVDLNTYKSVLEQDTESQRVIFYEDKRGAKVYKSTLTKKNNHLQIIKISDKTVLYDGVVQ